MRSEGDSSRGRQGYKCRWNERAESKTEACFHINVLFTTSLFYIFFVPVGLLISCDFFFNAPYSRLILSNSPAGVFVIHNSQSNVND